MIKKIVSIALLAAMATGCSLVGTDTHNRINLAGEWQFRLDPKDLGLKEKWGSAMMTDKITLPGTTSEAGFGTKLDHKPDLTKSTFVNLHQKYKYIGPAWYMKTVTIPTDWQGKKITLLLERVIWESRVFVNGHKVNVQDSLCTPHRHDLSKYLKPGKNTIAIRIDNRAKLGIGIGHAYTEATQTIWNGIVGRIELQMQDLVYVRTLKTYPDLNKNGVRLSCRIENDTDQAVEKELVLQVVAVNHSGDTPAAIRTKVTVPVGGRAFEFFYPMGTDYHKWSEFTPELYKMTATVGEESISEEFGMRTVTVTGRQFSVNGIKTFLRGTLECCIFPKTGYPAMNKKGWEKVFTAAKNYGLNHLRFHSWCPPEAAFEVADRMGFYLQVELPNWSFRMGRYPALDKFFHKEGERIFNEYANHPSFVFFSLGNELAGDLNAMDKYLDYFKKIEPRPLYTSTSYAFSPRGALPGRADDYFISQRTKAGWVRGQGFLNQTKPNTVSDYSKGLSCINIPLVSHEVGQYNVFPNLEEIPKYDGPLVPLGYYAIKEDLMKKGRLYEAKENTLNSGKLAVLLYKEDLERALRTKGQAGIQLLDLHDFPGQSTATVGVLDSFWDSKGLIQPEDFRRFCSPVVPLIRMSKMTYNNNETFEASIEIANFSPNNFKGRTVYWTIKDRAGRVIGEKSFEVKEIASGNGIKLGQISCSLNQVTNASELTVEVGIKGTKVANSWSVWVYPSNQVAEQGDVVVTHTFGRKLFKALSKGQNVLLLPERASIKHALSGRFIPVFWSPLHFPNQPGSLGTVIDSTHPLFKEFPTSTSTDWQWWELLATSYAVGTDALGPKFRPIMRFVDKFNRNSQPSIIWEATVGKGKLMVCSLDVEHNPKARIVAAQLKKAIFSYMNSSDFKPSNKLSPKDLLKVLKVKAFSVKLFGGTSHPSHALTNLIDRNANTFWHTDWTNQSNSYPYSIDISMEKAMTVSGLDYTPRQSGENGRIGKCRIEVKGEQGNWKTAVGELNFPNDAKVKKIRFRKPMKISAIRFVALAEVTGKSYASIGELKPIFTTPDELSDVSELGIIKGFNDGK